MGVPKIDRREGSPLRTMEEEEEEEEEKEEDSSMALGYA